MRLIIVLAVGLTYSVLPGVSMVGHIIGLVVGIAMAFLIPQTTARARGRRRLTCRGAFTGPSLTIDEAKRPVAKEPQSALAAHAF